MWIVSVWVYGSTGAWEEATNHFIVWAVRIPFQFTNVRSCDRLF